MIGCDWTWLWLDDTVRQALFGSCVPASDLRQIWDGLSECQAMIETCVEVYESSVPACDLHLHQPVTENCAAGSYVSSLWLDPVCWYVTWFVGRHLVSRFCVCLSILRSRVLVCDWTFCAGLWSDIVTAMLWLVHVVSLCLDPVCPALIGCPVSCFYWTFVCRPVVGSCVYQLLVGSGVYQPLVGSYVYQPRSILLRRRDYILSARLWLIFMCLSVSWICSARMR